MFFSRVPGAKGLLDGDFWRGAALLDPECVCTGTDTRVCSFEPLFSGVCSLRDDRQRKQKIKASRGEGLRVQTCSLSGKVAFRGFCYSERVRCRGRGCVRGYERYVDIFRRFCWLVVGENGYFFDFGQQINGPRGML